MVLLSGQGYFDRRSKCNMGPKAEQREREKACCIPLTSSEKADGWVMHRENSRQGKRQYSGFHLIFFALSETRITSDYVISWSIMKCPFLGFLFFPFPKNLSIRSVYFAYAMLAAR